MTRVFHRSVTKQPIHGVGATLVGDSEGNEGSPTTKYVIYAVLGVSLFACFFLIG